MAEGGNVLPRYRGTCLHAWRKTPLAPLGRRIFWSGLAFSWLIRNQSQKQSQGESRRRRRTKALFTKYFLNPNDVPSAGHMAPRGARVKHLEGEGRQIQRAATQDRVVGAP